MEVIEVNHKWYVAHKGIRIGPFDTYHDAWIFAVGKLRSQPKDKQCEVCRKKAKKLYPKRITNGVRFLCGKCFGEIPKAKMIPTKSAPEPMKDDPLYRSKWSRAQKKYHYLHCED